VRGATECTAIKERGLRGVWEQTREGEDPYKSEECNGLLIGNYGLMPLPQREG